MTKNESIVKRFIRSNNPLQEPGWSLLYTSLLLFFILAATFTVAYPERVAAWAESGVAGREWLIRMRFAIVGLIAFSLFAVRIVPWWRVASYTLISLSMMSTIARNEAISHSPLTLSFLLLLTGLLIEVSGASLRPTLSEQIARLRADLAEQARAFNALEEVNVRLSDENFLLQATNQKLLDENVALQGIVAEQHGESVEESG